MDIHRAIELVETRLQRHENCDFSAYSVMRSLMVLFDDEQRDNMNEREDTMRM